VSSIAHTRGKINKEDLNSKNKYDPGDAYSQSKLANVLFSKELAARLAGFIFEVYLVHNFA
jgi:NAD(P)-dependent dehydrogenase (short-subunit alcohol dehydrogenase family)